MSYCEHCEKEYDGLVCPVCGAELLQEVDPESMPREEGRWTFGFPKQDEAPWPHGSDGQPEEVAFLINLSDYAAVVESLATKKLDLAWLGGFTYVQAKIRTNGTAIPIVQRAEDAVFTSKFITADPSIQTLADLKGKTFAFGAPSSTSGSLMPRYFLLQDGLNPEKDFKTVAYSGAHDATVAFVAAGKAEAGVLNTSVWDKLVETKKVDTSKVRVFATTPTYFDYNWTVRGDLDPAVIKKLTDAFLALDPAKPEHKAIMDLQRASKFIPTKPENYAGTEAAAKSAGLLK